MGPRIVLVTALAVLAVLGACGGEDPPADTGTTPFGDADGGPGGGGPGSNGSSGAPGTAPYVDFDVNHVLITGQSNSVSNSGVPVLSKTQPFSNLMFDTGVMPMKGGFETWGDPSSGATPYCDGEGCTTYEEPTSFVP